MARAQAKKAYLRDIALRKVMAALQSAVLCGASREVSRGSELSTYTLGIRRKGKRRWAKFATFTQILGVKT